MNAAAQKHAALIPREIAKMMTETTINERALFARVDRALTKQNQSINRCRPDSPWRDKLGGLYILDMDTGSIARMHVDLESLAREIGAMKPYEKLAIAA